MDYTKIVPTYECIQWDGSNTADVLDMIGRQLWMVYDDQTQPHYDDETNRIVWPNNNWPGVSVGDWVVGSPKYSGVPMWSMSDMATVMDNASFISKYTS